MSAEEFDYTDEPLESVTQDSINIELRIGPLDTFTFGNWNGANRDVIKPTEETRRYNIIDAEVNLVDGTDSDYLVAQVVGDGHDILPDQGDLLSSDQEGQEIITLDVNNKLTQEQRGGEITRIFTGVVSNSSNLGNGRFELIGFWPGYNRIQDSRVYIPLPAAIEGPSTGNTTMYYSRSQNVSEIVGYVAQDIIENSPFDYQINLDDDGIQSGAQASGGSSVTTGFDPEITLESRNQEVSKILESLELRSESVWEVDRYGTFYFGAIQPNVHKIRYITDTSAGKQSPAWRSVRVIGDGVVSEDGWSASALVNENPVQLEENINDDEIDEGLAEPVFTYRNMEINTTEEANHVKNKLLDKINEQHAGGEIDVIGYPEIWPGDAIEMPDSEDQPFDLERFGVKRVIHRINNDDGFLTKIKCNGLTDSTEVLYGDDLADQIQERRQELKKQRAGHNGGPITLVW